MMRLDSHSGVMKVREALQERGFSGLLSEPLEMADAAYVGEKSGLAIGAVAPVGHAERLETMVEEDLLVEEVWSSAGHTHAVFGMEPTELVRLTGGRVVSVR
jgi:prolyl-tRNA editing enzyme YbaK/EbsC (Cys-tRNA(Pro) deacylase)